MLSLLDSLLLSLSAVLWEELLLELSDLPLSEEDADVLPEEVEELPEFELEAGSGADLNGQRIADHGAVVVHDHRIDLIAAAGDGRSGHGDRCLACGLLHFLTVGEPMQVFTLGIFALQRSLKDIGAGRKPCLPRCERKQLQTRL